ncbi:serine/threonine-protein phosphatase 6 regulatory ankyrin repeat subunit A-like isoform X2 [Dendronephthya gigantea]|uniref:serine/threonine-protein phosphatase 6 regulatory ankyrin repeat subunit A-like isoform X2 n=1 Tax=Dendronephthya gigantea TaxID=151771 RepID=UPI00106B020C|nr:serine/threonine-protein phosphatase 6 regulatory ankyrin repeat subunit A-like isoform X2 [Dendronephthya gigantea]
MNAIHEAVEKGDGDEVLSLLEDGHNINAINDAYVTPAYLAVLNKQYDVLKLLLNHNAVQTYFDPLLLATSLDSEEYVQILIDYKFDPSYQSDDSDHGFPINLWTALHEACHMGLKKILEIFVRTNCDLDIRNEENATPVYISCQYGEKECLELLLNHGADAEIPVETGETPLHIACQEGHHGCVATLLNYGVNIESRNELERTSLAVACYHEQYECAKLLIESNASIDGEDNDNSPIHLAARNIDGLCLSLLIENGADVNSDLYSCTPLYEAVSANNLPAVKLLLLKGADPNRICETKYPLLCKTPLMVATSEVGNVEIIRELVAHGADVNLRTFTSPLILAAKYKSCESLNELLSYDIDVNYVDIQGESALTTLCMQLIKNYNSDDYKELLQCCRKILVLGGNITQLITEPRQLTHLCRVKIRCLLGGKRLGHIKRLPLPTILKDYLNHKEEMTFE